jgi:hypothetical protein
MDQVVARAYSVHVAVLNGHVIAAFTVKHELKSWLSRAYSKAPTNLRIIRLQDGQPMDGTEDVTSKFWLEV